MSRTTIAGVLAYGVMLNGCAAESTLTTTDQGAEVTETVDPMDAMEGMETTGEAAQAVTQTQRDICLGAVTLGAGLGCLAATNACAGATVITVGGAAYPCAIVLAVACAALPAVAAVYYNRFCQNIR